ncbi:Holliday junction resolvase RuvX [Altericista sp. CCNU0014]|uniref:Holliday junction resolvase RuvX n=1 Tax=Altericista sp. CCNU0014 TaxID=3082949 RepID=UPI00384BC8DB
MSSTQSSLKQAIPLILGFDPGRDKCGVAVVGIDRSICFHEVIPAAETIAAIDALQQQYGPERLVMGDRTTALQWRQQLERGLAVPLPISFIDERYSTLEARDRYWAMYPPKGLARLVPQGMRDVPRPIDDIVAIILVERYLDRSPSSA